MRKLSIKDKSIIHAILSGVYFLWTKFAFVLSYLSTRLLFLFVFYFLFTPFGLLLKLFRVGLLDNGFSKGKCSYWVKSPQTSSNVEGYKNQF